MTGHPDKSARVYRRKQRLSGRYQGRVHRFTAVRKVSRWSCRRIDHRLVERTGVGVRIRKRRDAQQSSPCTSATTASVAIWFQTSGITRRTIVESELRNVSRKLTHRTIWNRWKEPESLAVQQVLTCSTKMSTKCDIKINRTFRFFILRTWNNSWNHTHTVIPQHTTMMVSSDFCYTSRLNCSRNIAVTTNHLYKI